MENTAEQSVIKSLLKECLTDVLDIKSVSGEEKDLADFIEKWIADLNNFDCKRFGNCLVAKTDVKKLQKRFILAGHIDTVPISTKTNNFPSFIDDNNNVWCRGSVDMKAGIAVMLTLMKLVDKNIDLLKSNITFVFYDNEEVEAKKNGLGIIVSQYPDLLQADAAILLEPTDNYIEGGCNGTLRFDISIKGKTSHSARPYKGDNAIHKLNGIIQILNEWNKSNPHLITVDDLEYLESLNAVKIEGGIATNMIPDLVKVHINYRFAPNKTVDQAKEYLLNVFDSLHLLDNSSDYQIEWIDESSGARPGLNNPTIKGFVEFATSITQKQVKAKYGWTDVARFYSLNIPALNFSPGDPNLCHADNEHVNLDDIVCNLKVFAKYFIND